jgi:hypothetical protein
VTDVCPEPFKRLSSPFEIPLVTVLNDDFSSYALGDLAGQGPWVAFSSHHLLVDAMPSATEGTFGTSSIKGIVTFDPQAFWVLETTVLRTTAGDGGGIVTFEVGGVSGNSIAVALTFNPGDGAANQVTLVAATVDTVTVASAGPMGWTDGVSHVVTLTSTGSTVSIMIDGTAVIPPTAGASPFAASDVVLQTIRFDVTDFDHITRVRLLTH